jgi:O-antigen/teichoic acid export membrane protein
MHSRRTTLLVFADQAMVSGCNFLVGALMARYLGVSDFGQWILVFGLVIYANTIAGALIWQPMLNLTPRLTDKIARQQFLSGAFACQWGLSLTAASVIAAGGLLASWLRPEWLSMSSAVCVAGVTLAFQLQDWLRRYCFAIEWPAPVFAMDVLAYGGQLALVVALKWTGQLSITTALMAVMVSYGASFLAGMVGLKVWPDLAQLKRSAGELWFEGRAYLVGEQLQWVGTTGLLYTSAHMMGPQATGAVRAAQNLLGPTNLLLQAFNNLVMVRCSDTFHKGGRPALTAYLWRVLLQFGVPLLAGLAVLSWFGAEAMALAFGQAFSRYGYLVPMQAAQVALTFMWLLALFRVRTLGRSDLIMKAAAVQAAVSLTVAMLSAPFIQESGVILASGLGTLAALLVLLKC